MTQLNIIRFWRDLEIFNLPTFEKDNHKKGYKKLNDGQIFPWENIINIENTSIPQGYTLLIGKLPKELVSNTIKKVLKTKDKEGEYSELYQDLPSLVACRLMLQGRPDEKSYFQASYPQGINCLEEEINVSQVFSKLKQVQLDFEQRYCVEEIEEGGKKVKKGIKVDWKTITSEINYVKSIIKNWYEGEILIFYKNNYNKNGNNEETSFLNSFYLEDFNLLLKDETPNFGTALDEYLSIKVSKNKRIDVIKENKELIKLLDPKLLPPGRWPSKVDFGLYSAQTAAVNNTFFQLMESSGLRGINGPPGTGKTTLLLDIIAQVIVKRAEKILETGDAFFSKEYNKVDRGNEFSGYFKTNEFIFKDSGIVVASSNNSAVENITKELPSLKKIDNDSFPHADYFRECSQRLIEGESWGILAAALGKVKNKNNFFFGFWKSDSQKNEKGFEDLLFEVYKGNYNKIEENKKLFENAKECLKQLLSEYKSIIKKAVYLFKNLDSHVNNIQLLESLNNQINLNTIQFDELSIAYNDNLEQSKDLAKTLDRLIETIKLHNTNRPYFFIVHKLLKTKIFKEWNESIADYLEQLKVDTTLQNNLNKLIKDLKDKINFTAKEITDLVIKKKIVYEAIEDYKVLQKDFCNNYDIAPNNFLDENFIELSFNEFHLSNPYSSKILNTLRSNIFLKSMDVHKYAILAHPKEFRNNLDLFFRLLKGEVHLSNEISSILWDTFFFCVPVISTSLASVGRLFQTLGKESLGWLLLDEAGQATPQSAAGIIWRSKRCIIIGDPLQIEPVVQIPTSLVETLRKQNSVDEIWGPYYSSVQTLADRISLHGTYMEVGKQDEKIWTGFPLRSHRRCFNPMFDIANEIAYSGQMVKAMPDKDEKLPPSEWYHIEGHEVFDKHVIKEELDFLEEKVMELLNSGFYNDIFVISPFKTVANFCSNYFKDVPSISCGTVHLFQGKEADIVFLILGSDPKLQGARNWASKKPNILNVAVTRAKKRFYVIGNKTLWSNCDYFNTLEARLGKVKKVEYQQDSK